MSGWGKLDNANNAPSYKIVDTSAANGQTMYANVVADNFISNVAVGVYGVAANQMPQTNTSNLPLHGAHAGWNVIRSGTGPVIDLTPNVANSTVNIHYANTNFVTVSNGTVNATANLVLNANGSITGITNLVGGAGFLNSNAVSVAISNNGANTTANGTGATFTVKLGGRAGRVQIETLVASGSITKDGNSAALPTL